MSDRAVSASDGLRPHFELRIAVPAGGGWASLVGEVAAHGARQCARADAEASAFGRTVEEAVRQACATARSKSELACVVRRVNGPLEVVIATEGRSRTLKLALEDREPDAN